MQSRICLRVILLNLLMLILMSKNIFSGSTPAGTQESPVELQNEPHHHLKFENKYVRVWDTLIPAQEATLWHIHSHNNVVLTLGDANVRVETVGADPAVSNPTSQTIRSNVLRVCRYCASVCIGEAMRTAPRVP